MPLQGFPTLKGRLQCESVDLEGIAEAVGTPTYVYSANAIRQNFRGYGRSLERIPHEIRYSVKANSSLAILALLHAESASFDIVSGGELYRVLKAGCDPSKVVYSGVGKTHAEMRYALGQGIGAFHCESSQELLDLQRLAAEMDVHASVALRVNPDIDAKTHPYIATGPERAQVRNPVARCGVFISASGFLVTSAIHKYQLPYRIPDLRHGRLPRGCAADAVTRPALAAGRGSA